MLYLVFDCFYMTKYSLWFQFRSFNVEESAELSWISLKTVSGISLIIVDVV